MDPSTPQQAVAWVQTAKYLEGRMQSTGFAELAPLATGAAMEALRTVLGEVSGTAGAWAALRQLVAKKVDVSPAIKAVLATQQTFLGGKATVEQAAAHMKEEFDQSQDFESGSVGTSSGAEMV